MIAVISRLHLSISICLFAAGICFPSGLVHAAEPEQRDSVAVLYDHIEISPSLPIDKKALVSELEAYLIASRKYRVIPRQDIAAILDELALSGKTSGSGTFKATYLITCTISKEGKQISLTLKMLRLIPGKQPEIWKTGPHFTASYDENNYRKNISEMLFTSIKMLIDSKPLAFEYALKICVEGNSSRAREIFKYIGTDFLPKEAASGQKHELKESVLLLQPEISFHYAWEAYEKGDMKKAAEFFLACREQMKIQSFDELTRIKDEKKCYQTPVVMKKWIIPDMKITFQPIEKGELSYRNDEKNISVRIKFFKDYWIAEKEICAGDYKIFLENVANDADINTYMDFQQEEAPLSKNLKFKPGIKSTSPVVCVTWAGAAAFADWLTHRERKAQRLPEGFCYRLPTEKEWDYAARLGSTGGINHQNEYAVCSIGMEEPLEKPNCAASRKADARGMFDMYGNVWEWCADWYDSGYGSNREANRESAEDCKVVRGGCYYSDDADLRKLRSPKEFRSAFPTVGFRVVLAPVISRGE